MDGRDKRKPSSPLPSHIIAKRSKSDDNGRSRANKRCTAEVSMATDASNFEKSCTPARCLYYEQGEWHDFVKDTSAILVAAFQARLRSVEFSLHGSRYLLSFVRMLQLNLITGFCQSIAWIDVSGQMFSPLRAIEGYGIHHRQFSNNCSRDRDAVSAGIISMSVPPHEDASPGLTSQESLLDVDASQQSTGSAIVHVSKSSASALSGHDHCDKGIPSDSYDTTSTVDSSNSISDATSNLSNANVRDCGLNGPRNFPLLQDKLVALQDTEPEFDEVKKRFMAGLSILANHTTVTSISKDCHRSSSGRVRSQAFKEQEEATRRARSDANVRYAWYGTSKKWVSSIVLHGFGQPKTPKDGAMYGAGIYLAPEGYANLSAVYSDVDENGEQHVVLCRVIMGHMEQIRRGSVQFHPSSEDFDGGVDDLCNPKQYIVWSTHMNTHILPEYIVSFKLTTPWQGIIAALRSKRKVCGRLSQRKCRYTRPAKEEDGLCAETMPRCSYSPPKFPWMSIEMLSLLLKSDLPAERMDALRQHYLDLKVGRLSSSDFINNVRVIAGDEVVNRSIKSMQTHVLGAAVLRNLLTSRRYQMADSNRVA